MRIYNSLSRQVEELVPIKKGRVGMYTCGMTVYDHAHIGHGRKYVYDDILRRVLIYNGFEVKHVQNVTDVGHLESDGDEGRDKMEKGAEKLKKSVWEVAKYYEADFYETMDRLNVLRPDVVCRATEHVEDMIKLTQKLVAAGVAYDTAEAVYFDVSKFERYGQLFHRIDSRQTAREEVHSGDLKRHPEDFALWFKRVGRFANHAMHWESPWGDGFPGWHIECSAMAMKYLGETVDIHTGGLEHQMVHHPNEIAQSEAATGKQFVRYWVHYGHLMIDGAKMSKSAGNYLRISDVTEKGYSPLALRYLYLTAHYRSPINFTWSGLTAAQAALDKLYEFVRKYRGLGAGERKELSREKMRKLDEYRDRFWVAVNDDLALPQALGVAWEMLKSNVPDYDKADTLLEWDQVLGLGLAAEREEEQASQEVMKLVGLREQLRREGRFVEADDLRVEIEKAGWQVRDTKFGPEVRRKQGGEARVCHRDGDRV